MCAGPSKRRRARRWPDEKIRAAVVWLELEADRLSALPDARLLHSFAGGFEDGAFFFGQRIESLRGDFVEDGIDFAADEVVGWFGAFGFLRGPWRVPGEAAVLFALEELKWPGEFAQEIV